ncbi:MAG: phytoene/squalene synthase family protein [Acidobacteria bacterium]|nr:phytoene/squalene synthase family protein [Acidobacteriota bacterium]MCW5969621.1 phytoene/squalene synthase family protein [Blastocatellales bacterium]
MSVWSEEYWGCLDRATARAALSGAGEDAAFDAVVREARRVLRTYSTSFFIVTRFLPPKKRAQVEAIYAAVRYPDEIVDTFPLDARSRISRLDAWQEAYEEALALPSLRAMLERDLPVFVSAFARVVRDCGIPPEHYRSFLDAMRCDAAPRRYETLDDLIESYIYGSAIVVGYFLAYVYGENRKGDFERALCSARRLGIALQLTNFLRDVGEDERRGRLYLPLDYLRAEGISDVTACDAEALGRVVRRLCAETEKFYELAQADLDAFAPDSQVAIRACIDVYRQLNARIGLDGRGIGHRETVPMREKFRVLPPSKYWRLPLAYLTQR